MKASAVPMHISGLNWDKELPSHSTVVAEKAPEHKEVRWGMKKKVVGASTQAGKDVGSREVEREISKYVRQNWHGKMALQVTIQNLYN